MKLKRYHGNPIISPNPQNDWERLVTTNPAAWYDENTKLIHLLYRAAGEDTEHRICFGMAVSKDGYTFKRVSDRPVFCPSLDGFDAGCVEDPRVVKIGEYFYITYAARIFPPGQYWLPDKERQYRIPECPVDFPKVVRYNSTCTGLMLTKDFKKFLRVGRLTDPMIDDRDVILFPEKVGGKYVMIHRPMEWIGDKYGTQFPAMWISTADDLLEFRDSKILAKAKYHWEGDKIGGNTPPIKTKHGWLFLYHAVGSDKHYRLGAMLLDSQDPSKVLHRTQDWIIQPEEDYELEGFYQGCIFPCGKVILNGTLFVYYGAADKYVALATCPVEELFDYIRSCPS